MLFPKAGDSLIISETGGLPNRPPFPAGFVGAPPNKDEPLSFFFEILICEVLLIVDFDLIVILSSFSLFVTVLLFYEVLCFFNDDPAKSLFELGFLFERSKPS